MIRKVPFNQQLISLVSFCFALFLLPAISLSQVITPNSKAASLTGDFSSLNDSLSLALKQDSLALQMAFDSLKIKGYSVSQAAQKADSLKEIFSARQQQSMGSRKTIAKKTNATLSQVQKALPNGKLPSEATMIINQVPDMVFNTPPPVPGINTNQSGLPNTPSFPSHPLPTPTNLPNKVNGQITEGAKDFFADHQKELNEARRKLARYNGREEKINDLKELQGKYLFLNPLTDKPWQERIIVGTLWQFSNQKQYNIDLGPNIAWRITDLFSIGGGFQYRLSASTKHSPWINSTDKVYGYYSFFDGKIKKGFFGRLQFEDLNSKVPRPDPANNMESNSQQWIKGLSVGFGKTYTFYKKVNGYSLLQYNLMHKHGETPYLRPLNLKIGFYINANHLIKLKKGPKK